MSDSLQFGRAEFAQAVPERVICAACQHPVIQSYYEIAGRVFCATCRGAFDAPREGSGLLRFLRATIAGLGAAIAGAAVWYGVRVLVELELALIAIGIAVAVGKAVRWGSRGVGGPVYQLLAVALTYTGIAFNYLPDLLKTLLGAATSAPRVLLVPIAIAYSYAVPFLMGPGNFLGWIIIAIGLWQAWKSNARVKLTINGPYSVAPSAPALVPALDQVPANV